MQDIHTQLWKCGQSSLQTNFMMNSSCYVQHIRWFPSFARYFNCIIRIIIKYATLLNSICQKKKKKSQHTPTQRQPVNTNKHYADASCLVNLLRHSHWTFLKATSQTLYWVMMLGLRAGIMVMTTPPGLYEGLCVGALTQGNPRLCSEL